MLNIFGVNSANGNDSSLKTEQWTGSETHIIVTKDHKLETDKNVQLDCCSTDKLTQADLTNSIVETTLHVTPETNKHLAPSSYNWAIVHVNHGHHDVNE